MHIPTQDNPHETAFIVLYAIMFLCDSLAFVRPLPERCRHADLGIKSPPAKAEQHRLALIWYRNTL